MKIDLNGLWMLRSQQYGDLTATIPGSVLSTLLQHKRIPDPFYRDNEEQVRQCLYHNYTLTRTFPLTKQQLAQHNYLFIDGIDTIARVYINDVCIAELFDMHTKKRIKLDNTMLSQENEIRVELTSPYTYIENYPDEGLFRTFAITRKKGPVIRKSHHMLGWDWGPDLADMGIYRDIYILSTDVGYLDSFRHECTFLEDGSVRVDVSAQVVCHTQGQLDVTLSRQEDGLCLRKTLPLTDSGNCSFLIEDPKLWYPVGFGEPNLYTLSFTLSTEKQQIHYSYRIGLRQVYIDNSADQYGTNFAVWINGEKVFLKGSNYIPEDNILSRVDKNRTLRLLKLVKDFNHNVIRVWGGGYYPDPWFYEYCDENGILVWQDLMFACACYNVYDEHFKSLIVEEVTDAVKSFRHHPCVFYIAGDNECEDGVNGHEPELMECYRTMSQEILVPLMKTLTSTFYAYTSPHSKRMFHMQNDHNHFDTHYWWIRDARLPIEDFKTIYPRMLSEVGHESFPMMDTNETYALPEDMDIHSRVMLCHEKRPTGNDTVAHYVRQRYGEPETFEEFIYLQNIVQGDAIRMCAEHLRCNKFRCNGILYWQLNDCWPGLSCSSVDYYFGLKALHYFSKKFYAPHLIRAELEKSKLVVSVANDTPREQTYQVLYRLEDFSGKCLQEQQLTVTLPKTDCAKVLILDDPFGQAWEEQLVYVRLTDSRGSLLSENYCQKLSDKQILYPRANIRVEQAGENSLRLETDVFTKNVFLQLGGTDTVFSDNFFHLRPGEAKLVTANIPVDMQKLKVMSLDQVRYRKEENEK